MSRVGVTKEAVFLRLMGIEINSATSPRMKTSLEKVMSGGGTFHQTTIERRGADCTTKSDLGTYTITLKNTWVGLRVIRLGRTESDTVSALPLLPLCSTSTKSCAIGLSLT